MENGVKVSIEAVLVAIGSYGTNYGYNDQTQYIYVFQTDDGQVYTWNTQKELDCGKCTRLKVTGTVKGEGEYKGVPQIKLTRCKVEFIDRKETYDEYVDRVNREKEEAKEAKRQEQMNSIGEGDEILAMTYKNYKEHYADCELVIDSVGYNENNVCVCSVIVRAGRLVASGVRGKMYKYFTFVNENGETSILKAMSEENARKRLAPGKWVCTHSEFVSKKMKF